MNYSNWEEKYKKYAEKLVKDFKVPGTAIGICNNGEMIFNETFGYRDTERELKINNDTIFGIGSITKSFTCMAIMQLQEANKLNVHDPVVKYLPTFKMPKNKFTNEVTIHHLLTHTAGLPPLPSIFGALKSSMEIDPYVLKNDSIFSILESHPNLDTFDDLLNYIASYDIDVLGPPGRYFSYSNDGMGLLGGIIAKCSRKTYEQYIVEHILNPAGMNDTVFLLNEAKNQENITEIYVNKIKDKEEKILAAPCWWDAPSMRSAGFLKSSINDLLKYNEIFRTGGLVGNNRLLTEESVKSMYTPYIKCEIDKYYGYGLIVVPNSFGGTLIEHSGGIKGVSSQMFIIPERGITGAILTNIEGVSVKELMMGALNLISGQEVNTPLCQFSKLELAEDELNKFVGSFVSSDENTNIKVIIEDSSLKLNILGEEFDLVSVDEDKFIFRRRDSILGLVFFSGLEGDINKVLFGGRILSKQTSNELQVNQ